MEDPQLAQHWSLTVFQLALLGYMADLLLKCIIRYLKSFDSSFSNVIDNLSLNPLDFSNYQACYWSHVWPISRTNLVLSLPIRDSQ